LVAIGRYIYLLFLIYVDDIMPGEGYKTVVLPLEVTRKLDKMKEYERESYSDVIKRLLTK